ncbi:DoxX family protein [Opitutaceae bacterium EW11]|nr:DoxX family protein [Opitutaceae bacterium EW11]
MNLSSAYSRFHSVSERLRSPLLLIIRVFWGAQFIQTGWGKLTHLERTTEYFASLGIPAAHLNALAAGSTECLGGLLLLLGLGARLASVPLLATMAVAYATAERDAFGALFREPDKFTSAAPFLFLLASLIVLAFGPGAFSLDRLLLHENSIQRKT